MALMAELLHLIKNSAGLPVSGSVRFDDGREWEWFRSTQDKTLHFNVDSGRPSQWATGNVTRVIAPPKRVAALHEALVRAGFTDYAGPEDEAEEMEGPSI